MMVLGEVREKGGEWRFKGREGTGAVFEGGLYWGAGEVEKGEREGRVGKG